MLRMRKWRQVSQLGFLLLFIVFNLWPDFILGGDPIFRGLSRKTSTSEFIFGWLVSPLIEAIAASTIVAPASLALSTDAA